MRKLAPGKYQLVPFENDGREAFAPTNPSAGDSEEADFITIRSPSINPKINNIPIANVPGAPDRLIFTLDVDDNEFDGIATTTPFGPLTMARQYLLMPCDQLTANEQPDEQYANNWISFELTEETMLTVEGPRITIGDKVIDLSALPDVSTSTYRVDGERMSWGEIVRKNRVKHVVTHYHVARAGDAVHAVLSKGKRTFDDGVLILIHFTPDMIAEMRAIDDPVARVYAAEMEDQAVFEQRHIVVRPAVGRNV